MTEVFLVIKGFVIFGFLSLGLLVILFCLIVFISFGFLGGCLVLISIDGFSGALYPKAPLMLSRRGCRLCSSFWAKVALAVDQHFDFIQIGTAGDAQGSVERS